MRVTISGAVVLMTVALPVLAADIPAASKIDAVTVFPSGAEVRRVVSARVEAGDHTLVLQDLPVQANPASVRVEGKATGRLDIGSVDTRRLSVARSDAQAMVARRRALEEQIRGLKDRRAEVEAEIATAEQQKAFLANLVQLPTRPVAAPQGSPSAAREDWQALLALIGQETAKASRAVLDGTIKLRKIDEEMRDAEGQLRGQPAQVAEVTEVRVNLSAAAALDAEFVITYQVAGASWSPLYDARLSTGSRTASPKLTITRRAQITQRTGEAWNGVQLALSTTRPGAGSAAPDLRPITVDFLPDRTPPPPMPVAAAPAAGAMAREERLAAQSTRKAAVEADASPEPVAIADRLAQVDVSSFQAVFAIPGRTDVDNTGTPKRVAIEEAQIEPALVARTVPRVDARAFLYAKMVMPRTTPYLPGPVSLFRDGTFVGNGSLPQLAPGEEHELGFGADDLIRVRAVTIDEKKGEGGLISSTRTEQRTWRITVKNSRDRPVQVSVLDQVPVSNQQDIKVEMTAKPQPTRRDVEDKRGVIAWDDRLNPDEERVYEISTKITWPGTKQIVVGR